MATIRIPATLRYYTGGNTEILVEGHTVGEAVDALTVLHPMLRKHLLNEKGQLRPFVNLFLNDEDIRFLQGVNTPLREDDHLILIPSITGGSCSVLPVLSQYQEFS